MNMETYPYLLLCTAAGDQCLELKQGYSWIIGRSKQNQFVIHEQSISREHAMIQLAATGEFYLTDLGSRNGSSVNGRRISIPVKLRHGDHITLGNVQLKFHDPARVEREKITELENNRYQADPTDFCYERRLISVLVTDLRNFTPLARDLTEAVLLEMMSYWCSQSVEILARSGSSAHKYIGDAVMGIWVHEREEMTREESVNIFQALIDIHQLTLDLNNRYSLPFCLNIGAGINTGWAMVGNVGKGEHPDYTAIGDTVNAAFRLEAATKEIHENLAMGETTYEYLTKLEKMQEWFRKHEVRLKGYEGSKITYATTFEEIEQLLSHMAK